MEGLSSLFSSTTLAEGMSLVAGMAEAAVVDPELLAMEAELKCLKQEVDQATSNISDAMWDDVNDDDLRFILHIQAGLG